MPEVWAEMLSKITPWTKVDKILKIPFMKGAVKSCPAMGKSHKGNTSLKSIQNNICSSMIPFFFKKNNNTYTEKFWGKKAKYYHQIIAHTQFLFSPLYFFVLSELSAICSILITKGKYYKLSIQTFLDLEETHLIQNTQAMVRESKKKLPKGHTANNSCNSKSRTLYMTPVSQDLWLSSHKNQCSLFLWKLETQA